MGLPGRPRLPPRPGSAEAPGARSDLPRGVALRLVAAEALLAWAPAALALGAAVLLGAMGPVMTAGLGTIALLAALALACWRVRSARRLGSWLGRLSRLGAPAAAPPLRGSLATVTAPAVELARRLEQAERRLAAHGRRLGPLIAALPDPILLLDRSLVIRLGNPAADRTLGLVLRDLPLGRALRDPGVLAAVNAALHTMTTSNVTFSPATDRMKQFAARVAPIELDDGQAGALLALREQTEQVIIERMRSDFVANASHEIKTPLSAIVGIVETLQGPARRDPAATDMFLAMLGSEVQRMQRLVEDLLSLSRVELVANQPPEQLVDVGEVARDVTHRLAPIAERAQVRLALELEPGLPRARADSDQLHQLIGNLVDNAIKYGGTGKNVGIEVRLLPAAPADAGPVSRRPCLSICVSDGGEGIAAEHIPRLTERFYRVDKARSRKIGGTGLGLAIVKHIIRRHQGHLMVTSELGHGSRFCALLPVPDPGSARHADTGPPSGAADRHDLHLDN